MGPVNERTPRPDRPRGAAGRRVERDGTGPAGATFRDRALAVVVVLAGLLVLLKPSGFTGKAVGAALLGWGVWTLAQRHRLDAGAFAVAFGGLAAFYLVLFSLSLAGVDPGFGPFR